MENKVCTYRLQYENTLLGVGVAADLVDILAKSVQDRAPHLPEAEDWMAHPVGSSTDPVLTETED